MNKDCLFQWWQTAFQAIEAMVFEVEMPILNKRCTYTCRVVRVFLANDHMDFLQCPSQIKLDLIASGQGQLADAPKGTRAAEWWTLCYNTGWELLGKCRVREQ